MTKKEPVQNDFKNLLPDAASKTNPDGSFTLDETNRATPLTAAELKAGTANALSLVPIESNE